MKSEILGKPGKSGLRKAKEKENFNNESMIKNVKLYSQDKLHVPSSKTSDLVVRRSLRILSDFICFIFL